MDKYLLRAVSVDHREPKTLYIISLMALTRFFGSKREQKSTNEMKIQHFVVAFLREQCRFKVHALIIVVRWNVVLRIFLLAVEIDPSTENFRESFIVQLFIAFLW